MRTFNIKPLILAPFVCLLASCGFFDKDNTPEPKPLKPYTQEVRPQLIWSAKTGNGTDGEYMKLSPVIDGNNIFASNLNGVVSALNKTNGQRLWQVNTKADVNTGPAAGDGLVVVGTRQGDVIALDETTGQLRWKTNINGEILANPAISSGSVIIKTLDGYLKALSTADGSVRWTFQQTEPVLILRGASTPLIQDHNIIVGFSNGNLSRISLGDGQLVWVQAVSMAQGAFAIERMIDIDADPVVYHHQIYAATYQGSISSIDWTTGRVLWTHDISSYTGMTATDDNLFISDAKSDIWSFGANSGLVNWRQTDLEARIVSGPASMGNYIVVGDGQGYLHWLAKSDGHVGGRIYAGAPISASPLVENNIVYAQTQKGTLLAYTAKS